MANRPQMTASEFSRRYGDWKVYLFEAKPGTVFCPHCNNVVRSIAVLLPPYICERDKIFFDPVHRNMLDRKVNLIAKFYAGDLMQLYLRYEVISLLHHVETGKSD